MCNHARRRALSEAEGKAVCPNVYLASLPCIIAAPTATRGGPRFSAVPQPGRHLASGRRAVEQER
eukprot:9089142-Lingulodinium_polyedra.AAC.1